MIFHVVGLIWILLILERIIFDTHTLYSELPQTGVTVTGAKCEAIDTDVD